MNEPFLNNHGKEEIVEFFLQVAITYKNQRDECNMKLLTLRNRIAGLFENIMQSPDKALELVSDFQEENL
jgi:hypothetical protein